MQTEAPKLAKAKTRLLVTVACQCRASIRQTADALHLLFSRGTSLEGLRIVMRRRDYLTLVSNGPMLEYSRVT